MKLGMRNRECAALVEAALARDATLTDIRGGGGNELAESNGAGHEGR